MKDAQHDEPRSSGAMLLNLWIALSEMVGREAYEKGIDALAADVRDEIRGAQAISWIRMSTSFLLVDAVARVSGRDPEKLYDEAVRRAVLLTYGGVWKVLLRLQSPDALLTRASLLYSKSRNWGKMSAVLLGEQRAELRVTEWPLMSDRSIRAIALSSVGILELTGQRVAESSYISTRDGALIRLRWSDAKSRAPR